MRFANSSKMPSVQLSPRTSLESTRKPFSSFAASPNFASSRSKWKLSAAVESLSHSRPVPASSDETWRTPVQVAAKRRTRQSPAGASQESVSVFASNCAVRSIVSGRTTAAFGSIGAYCA